MICTVQGCSDPRFRGPLETMFEDRKRLFVDLLGWDLGVREGRWEIDAFDGEHAVYLIAIDQTGDHIGSLRLLPSALPHILSTLFPELCSEGVPRGPTTFEITRLCLPVRHGADERLRIRDALITAMVDHALSAGITQLTGVVETGFLKQILRMGWRARALGPARQFGGAALGAFLIDVDAATPTLLAATGIYARTNTTDRAGEIA
ncbi:acyl-homoserine-lactone synthase [Rhizorhabdus dicambivorans]|uniref:Acyl-homoserine-lactone synthase n=1 Tax=Rhizorhabdus dicambivorans TaxID=1850238 RepID=A0A2A4FNB4_9SPHN|nr:acyl-homoserine-lactone synthase [Rhizorhabdus dicambivorans]ATE65157.1 autoinducer synthase [Rhizorhabdus dicambivorans]PCE39893.1 autoinducer synthase [Rhizorhabdus dicambivorans]